MTAVALACTLVALALGAFSSCFFVWQWIGGAPTAFATVVLLLSAIVAAAALFTRLRRRMIRQEARPGAMWLVVAVVAASVASGLVRHAEARPHGGWDAWAIWNLHARFLDRGADGSWKEMFAPSLYWSHPDYPLLLPGLTAATWRLIGSEDPIVPAVYGVVFVLLTVALVGSAASAWSGDDRGIMSALVLLATPAYLLQSGEQMADVPLALYVAIGVILLAFAELHPKARRTLLVLSGFSAGLAAWTKNEGLLFAAALLGAHTGAQIVRREWRQARQDLSFFVAGAAPLLILVGAFKIWFAPGSDLFAGGGKIDRLLTGERYAFVASAFADELFRFGDGSIHPFLIAAVSPLAYGIVPRRRAPLGLAFVPIAMLAGYFLIYILTPNDLAWQVHMSLPRLLLQLWPTCVFLVSILVSNKR